MSNPFAQSVPAKPVKPVRDPFGDKPKTTPVGQPSNPFAKSTSMEIKKNQNPFGEESVSPSGSVNSQDSANHKVINPFSGTKPAPPVMPRKSITSTVIPNIPTIPVVPANAPNSAPPAPPVPPQFLPLKAPLNASLDNNFTASTQPNSSDSFSTAPLPNQSQSSNPLDSENSQQAHQTAPPAVVDVDFDSFESFSKKSNTMGLPPPVPIVPATSPLSLQNPVNLGTFQGVSAKAAGSVTDPFAPTSSSASVNSFSESFVVSTPVNAPPPRPVPAFNSAAVSNVGGFDSFQPNDTDAVSADPFVVSTPISAPPARPVFTASQSVSSSAGFDSFEATAPGRSDPFTPSTPVVAPPPRPSFATANTLDRGGFDSFSVSVQQQQPQDPFAAPAAPAAVQFSAPFNSSATGFDDFDSFGAASSSASFGATSHQQFSAPAFAPQTSEFDSFEATGVSHMSFNNQQQPAPVTPVSPVFVAPAAPTPVVDEGRFVGLPPLVPDSVDDIDETFIIKAHAYHHPVNTQPAPVAAPVKQTRHPGPAMPPKPAHVEGDPFATLVKPLKPVITAPPAAAAPVDPNAGLSLSQIAAKKNAALLSQQFQAPATSQQQQQPPVSVSSGGFSSTSSAPVADPSFDLFSKPQQKNVAPAFSSQHQHDDMSAWGAPTSSSASHSSFDEFGSDTLSHQTGHTNATHASAAGFDDWATPSAAHQTPQKVVATANDFDLFSKPAVATKPATGKPVVHDPFAPHPIPAPAHQSSYHALKPQPLIPQQAQQHSAAPAVDEFDIFSPKKVVAPTVTKVPSGGVVIQQSEYDIFSPKRAMDPPAGKAVSSDSFDFDFDKPVSLDSHNSKSSTTNMKINKPTNSGSNSNNSNSYHSDPFASNTKDPFAEPSTPNPVEKEKVMEKFRQMYNIPANVDDDESHGDSESDDYDALDRRRGFQSTITGGSTVSSLTQPSTYGGDMRSHSDLMEGEILARLSTRSLVTKDWHDIYYIIENGALFLYRNKLDYQYNPKGVNYKKKIPITHNLRLLKINAKDYKGYGTVYNFMLEEVLDYGPSNLGKLGSTYRPTIELLWNQLKELILQKRKEKATPVSKYGK